MTAEKPKPKPCPFCGSVGVRAIRGVYARTPPPPFAWCEACGATGPRCETEREALARFHSVAAAAYRRGIDEAVKLAKEHAYVDKYGSVAFHDVDRAISRSRGGPSE